MLSRWFSFSVLLVAALLLLGAQVSIGQDRSSRIMAYMGDKSDIPGHGGNSDPNAGDHDRDSRHDKPEKEFIDKVHPEGGGWGSISTGRAVEPSGYSKDGTIGIGVSIHFLKLDEPKKHWLNKRPQRPQK